MRDHRFDDAVAPVAPGTAVASAGPSFAADSAAPRRHLCCRELGGTDKCSFRFGQLGTTVYSISPDAVVPRARRLGPSVAASPVQP